MQLYSPDTLIGQYEIVSNPMVGGMGVVYFCLDHGNDERPVALKTFRPELLSDRAARDRFLREGTTWVKLGSHPHIVRCYKVEYIDPTAFLVLELIAKEKNMADASLRSWLIPGRPLPLEQALLFALQIARGMKYATEKIPGLVHRDLKPENILVGADKLPGMQVNHLRVTDFGLAAILKDETDRFIADEDLGTMGRTLLTHGILGTPLYMAPEQWAGNVVMAYTDIYALGCILYEMLAGNHVVEGRNMSNLRAAHCCGKLCPVPAGLPVGVNGLLAHFLALSSTNRYQTWEQVTKALEDVYQTVSGRAAPGEPITGMVSHEDRKQVGWSYNAMGMSYLDMGKAEVAVGYFERALGMAREIGDQAGEAAILDNLGVAYSDVGDVMRAISYFEQCLVLMRGNGDRRGEVAALGNLGIAYKNLGDVRRAISYHEQCLELDREIGDQSGESADFGNLGNAYFTLGDAQRAIGFYEQALEIDRNIGDQRGESKELGNLGNAYLNLGDVQRAIGCFERNLKIAHAIGDKRGEGNAVGNLGNAYLALGDVSRAITFYEQQHEIKREVGDQRGLGIALANLGNAYLTLGDAQQAIEFYEQALAMAHKTGDRHSEGTSLSGLGNSYLTLGNPQMALKHFEQALEIQREIGDRLGEGNALGSLGNILKELGDIQSAIGYYEQCLKLFREIGNQRGESTALSSLGNAYMSLDNPRMATDFYEQALGIQRKIGNLYGVAIVSFNMALLYAKLGEITHALSLAQETTQILTRMGHPRAKIAHKLVIQLQDEQHLQASPNEAIKAFLTAESMQEMQVAVEQYPTLKDDDFFHVIEEFIREGVQSDDKPVFEQRLIWLKRIVGK